MGRFPNIERDFPVDMVDEHRARSRRELPNYAIMNSHFIPLTADAFIVGDG